jgi:hypothetical protein
MKVHTAKSCILMSFALKNDSNDFNPCSERPRKKQRVHFSENTICRSYFECLDSNKQPLETLIAHGDAEQLPGNSYSQHGKPCGFLFAFPATLPMADFKVEMKKEDGPCPITLATESVILQILKKKAAKTADKTETAEAMTEFKFGEGYVVNLKDVGHATWLQIQDRLEMLIDRIASSGRASLLPSTSILRSQHLPILRAIADGIATSTQSLSCKSGGVLPDGGVPPDTPNPAWHGDPCDKTHITGCSSTASASGSAGPCGALFSLSGPAGSGLHCPAADAGPQSWAEE